MIKLATATAPATMSYSYANEANSLTKASKIWHVAERISALVSGILVATALFSGTIASALLPPLSFGSLAVVVAGGMAFNLFLSPYCKSKSEYAYREAVLAKGMAESLDHLASWSNADFKEFSTSLGIQEQEIEQKAPPLLSIAQFLYYRNVAGEALGTCERNLAAAKQYQETPPKSETEETAFEVIYELRKRAHEAIENVLLPSILKCAFLIRKISGQTAKDEGKLLSCSFNERTYRLSFNGDDTFYHFSDPQKAPITREELIRYFTEDRLGDCYARLCLPAPDIVHNT